MTWTTGPYRQPVKRTSRDGVWPLRFASHEEHPKREGEEVRVAA